MKPTKFLRPAPVNPKGCRSVLESDSPRDCAKALWNGKRLVLTCDYRKGAAILGEIEKQHPAPAEADFAARTAHQIQIRTAQLRLLAPIRRHRVELQNARKIGFLRELYPERVEFALPFPEIQALHGAWNTYKEGKHLAVLGHQSSIRTGRGLRLCS